MVSGNRGNNFLELTKRPSPIEKGVSLCRKEPLLTSKKRPLHLQTIVFTPLSIRRGDGGGAFSNLLPLGTPLLSEGLGEAFTSLPYPTGGRSVTDEKWLGEAFTSLPYPTQE